MSVASVCVVVRWDSKRRKDKQTVAIRGGETEMITEAEGEQSNKKSGIFSRSVLTVTVPTVPVQMHNSRRSTNSRYTGPACFCI